MKKLMQKSRTRQELLDNTVRHFNSTNRSIKDGTLNDCMYRSGDGCGCAIGREISDDLAKKLNNVSFGIVDNIFDKLPLRLKNLGVNFLREIQFLHDLSWHWNEVGLSNIGRENVDRICEKFQLKNPAEVSDQN